MKITSLKETKAGRISLYIDREFVTSLDTLTFAEYGLCVDDEITEETLSEMLRLSKSRRAKQKAVEYLSYRLHSKAELKRKLLRSATEEDAQKAVDRMEELQMVDDLSFAKTIVREYSEIKLYGINRVTQELYRRGIERDVMMEALDELPDQSEILDRVIKKMRVELKGSYTDKERLLKKLLSRGFDYEDIRPVLWNFEIEQ